MTVFLVGFGSGIAVTVLGLFGWAACAADRTGGDE
jgi:hypothetical protein